MASNLGALTTHTYIWWTCREISNVLAFDSHLSNVRDAGGGPGLTIDIKTSQCIQQQQQWACSLQKQHLYKNIDKAGITDGNSIHLARCGH